MDPSSDTFGIAVAIIRNLGLLALVLLSILLLFWRFDLFGTSTRSQRAPEADVLEPIRETDPAFTWEAFHPRVLAAYKVIQRARMVKQPNLATKWVAPAQLIGLENEAAHAKRAGISRTVAPIEVTRAKAMRVRSDGSSFFLDVRIVAETTLLGRRALMNETTAGLFEQDDAPVKIDEMWTFCRPIGSQTATQPADPGHCTHCGAPIGASSAGDCPYCGKALAEADWLVSAIAPTDFSATAVPEPHPRVQSETS